jgi:Uma2 family endonuclease
MSAAAPARFTEQEYLALERASDRKHEYVDGVIVAMAGARPPHNIIAANVVGLLAQLAVRGPCVTMTSDQRVHVPKTKLYAYPDVTVACGERRYDDGDPPSLLNPTLLVEVTSDSTEDFDRGTKFLHYQSIPQFDDYLIVSHRERRIDHYRRLRDGQWHLSTHTDDAAVVSLPALDGSFQMADAYQNVDLAEGVRASE